jgi:hypothetical protein
MRFIADSMLGRLARWLRLLGHDTIYHPQIEDRVLLRIAREDNRILLTRDSRLVKVRGLKNFLLLKENNTFEQLKSVIKTFNLSPYDKFNELKKTSILSRCALCNSVLNNIPKEQAKDYVPKYVYITCDVFKRCSKCNKLYWKGTHPEHFRKKLEEIFRN